MDTAAPQKLSFDVHPNSYRHWTLSVDGELARLTMRVTPFGGANIELELKSNSYDLSVDIELADAVQRLRFEHPQVKACVITSGHEKIFCAGANIYMLASSTHPFKVNFCKYTNETRLAIEDASQHSGLKFLAACNGACAGGGYELALACDEIVLVDDRSSSVSLPEVPLLGVLPGTGGLTRVTDKRRVRHDLADIFCTSVEGVRGQRAVAWRLVDAVVKPAQFGAFVQERAKKLAAGSHRPADARGVALPRIERDDTGDALRCEHVRVDIDRAGRTATFTVKAPTAPQPDNGAGIEAAGASWWPLAMAGQLDGAVLWMRTKERDMGTWLVKTEGDPAAVLAVDATLVKRQDHWFVGETIGALRRTFAR